MSAGTLYPILHGLERKGHLRSSEQQIAGRVRRIYRATAKERVWELFGEMFEPAGAGGGQPHHHDRHETEDQTVTSRSSSRKKTTPLSRPTSPASRRRA